MTRLIPSSSVHPDLVLKGLLERTKRSDKQGNLRAVNEICRAQHATKSKDFAIPTIGRLVEAAGILKAAALKTMQSADYRELILAWAAYAGPPDVKKGPTPVSRLAAPDWLMKIDDPAARSIVQSIIIERDRLKQQLNTLKVNSNITIDMRPLPTRPAETMVTLLAPTMQLNDAERAALEEAVSATFLAGEGWHEGPRGEILNDKGRKVYRPGYLTGLRKLAGKQ